MFQTRYLILPQNRRSEWIYRNQCVKLFVSYMSINCLLLNFFKKINYLS